MKRVAPVVTMAMLTLFGLALVGCGGSKTKQQECWAMTVKAEHDVCVAELRQERGQPVSGDEEESTPEEAAAVEEVEATAVHLTETTRFYLTSQSGYKALIELSRGPVERIRGQVNGALAEGSGCQVDPRVDAVEPIELAVENRTKRFPASPGLMLYGRTPRGELPGASVEVTYVPESPSCVGLLGDTNVFEGDETNIVYLSPNDALQPFSRTSALGFIVLENFYSPAHPNGERAKYQNALLMLEPIVNTEYLFEVAKAEGVLSAANGGVKNALPLIPGQHGGCLVNPPCPPAFKME